MKNSVDHKSDSRQLENTIKKLTLKREALKKLKIRSGIATGGSAIKAG
jgi:hypothetical protein